MTIDAAYQFIQFISNKKQNGYITPAQFNNLASIAQMSVVNDRLGNVKKYPPGNPIPPYGFELNQKSREELRPLMVRQQTVAVSSGIASIPADYLYYDTIEVSGKRADEVTEDQILELNNSSIKPPTTTFPKFTLSQSGIAMYPASITSIKLSYLRKPANPVWAYTIVNDEPIYNSGSSQNFELSPGTHLEICMLILQSVGISLSIPELTQYSQMAQQEGK